MKCFKNGLWGINPSFPGLFPCTGQLAYALLTHPPVSIGRSPYTPRLACVKPAASVHPEPGSNSSSYNLQYNMMTKLLKKNVLILEKINREPLSLIHCTTLNKKIAHAVNFNISMN